MSFMGAWHFFTNAGPKLTDLPAEVREDGAREIFTPLVRER